MKIKKIISGGQTGVDRAAIDSALIHSIDYGGYCPKGRKAEDGSIDKKYKLIETKSSNYYDRTFKNIKLSDGVLIITKANTWGKGTLLTEKYCNNLNKKYVIIDIDDEINNNIQKITNFIKDNEIEFLNIAGNRESTSPGIYEQTKNLLNILYRNE